MMTTAYSSLLEAASHGLYLGQSPSMFVTADDIESIKAAARQVLPEVKPQMRLEAVARALRFKSFAAMKSAVMRATKEDPVLLQMAFGKRWGALEDGFQEHLQGSNVEFDEQGLPVSSFGYISTGAVFLSALYCAREGSLKEYGQDSIFRIGVETKIGAHHRAAVLQGLPDAIKEALRSEGTVLKLDTGVEIAPVARVAENLRQLSAGILFDEIDGKICYDSSYVDFAGEGGWFGKIPLDSAIFVSNNKDRIDVLPIGWCCSWSYSIGAVFSDWEDWTFAERLEHLREHFDILVEDFNVPRKEVGNAFNLVPELANEPEARAVMKVATPRNFEELLNAAFDGFALRM